MNDKMQNQESLEEFIQLALQDLGLQQKLKATIDLATTDHEAALCSIVEIGKEYGYSFTSWEVAERLQITATPSDPFMELSDWELEAVAGGKKSNMNAPTPNPTCWPCGFTNNYCPPGQTGSLVCA